MVLIDVKAGARNKMNGLGRHGMAAGWSFYHWESSGRRHFLPQLSSLVPTSRLQQSFDTIVQGLLSLGMLMSKRDTIYALHLL
ncbi:hypothetical protein L208DRAFT_1401470 [Tricholoma matsutake]|nr:hypothetical protein L208DRAFT_1401470 [Tricholoma matsutake 945]